MGEEGTRAHLHELVDHLHTLVGEGELQLAVLEECGADLGLYREG